MAESIKLDARQRLKIVSEEIAEFERLIKGHRKLLEAIGSL